MADATTIDKPETKPAADAAPADKTVAPATGKAIDKPADKPSDKAPEADKAKVDADASTDTDSDGGATEEGSSGDDWLDDGEAAPAGEADGKEAADKDAAAKAGDKPKADAAWRDTALKAAEAKLLKKAKTDDDKKAVATQTERLKKQLARYGTPEAAILAGMEAQEKLRGGAKTAKPGPDAAPEDVAKWREAEGLPADPADIAIPRIEVTNADGSRAVHKWTDADKPLHDSFRDLAYDLGMSQEAVNRAVQWQVKEVQEATQRQKELITHVDKEDRKEMMEALREEYADEIKPRMTMVTQLINDREVFPEDVSTMLWNARTPDGRRLMNQAALVKFFSEKAVEQYGDGGLIVGDKRVAIEDEEAKWVSLMKTDFDEYARQNGSEKLAAIRERKAGKRGKAA